MGFFGLFGNREAEQRRYYDDLDALQQMRLKHGDSTRAELERRAADRSLRSRDRRHWQRLLRVDDTLQD